MGMANPNLVESYDDYREYLKQVLADRMQKNPRYSLRAFARDLGLAPQNLSAIFHDKRGLSLERALKISVSLGLNSDESQFFCDLVQFARAKSNASQTAARLRLSKFRRPQGQQYEMLKEDVFHAISDWYHFAILELTYVKGFKSDAKWIASQLGISTHEAKQAILRLARLKLLEVKNKRFKKVAPNTATQHDVPSEAIKHFNRQILEKAKDALTFQHINERDFTTITMSINPAKIPEAKKLIKQTRRDLCELLETGERSAVYCFSAQLFRLSTSVQNHQEKQL